MSRILFINSVCNGSTGTICKNLYKAAEKEGNECCIAYGRGNPPEGFNSIKIGKQLDIYMHVLKARLFDASGFGSKHATREFIKKIDEFNPDIIHLHNIHGYYVNIEILFDYLKRHPEIKKIWTLHDCWAFTGHCAYYTYAKCNKWQTICDGRCLNRKDYPKTLISRTKVNYLRKKEIFNNLQNIILVTPSKWLKREVRLSYLNEYEILVINNGVDTTIFQPSKSSIKEEYDIEEKKVILGVASVWDNRKGLDIFIELSKQLDMEYQIVLIGLSDKQIQQLPSNIIGISRTEDIQELAKWYSAAYVYLNPTLEDNYPTTNLEAIACGTPVITFNTGGSPESAFIKENIVYDTGIKSIKNKIDNYKFDDINKKCFFLETMINNYSLLYR